MGLLEDIHRAELDVELRERYTAVMLKDEAKREAEREIYLMKIDLLQARQWLRTCGVNMSSKSR